MMISPHMGQMQTAHCNQSIGWNQLGFQFRHGVKKEPSGNVTLWNFENKLQNSDSLQLFIWGQTHFQEDTNPARKADQLGWTRSTKQRRLNDQEERGSILT